MVNALKRFHSRPCFKNERLTVRKIELKFYYRLKNCQIKTITFLNSHEQLQTANGQM
jgi:hypothetical protein